MEFNSFNPTSPNQKGGLWVRKYAHTIQNCNKNAHRNRNECLEGSFFWPHSWLIATCVLNWPMLIDTPPRMHGGCCVSPIWGDHFEILSSRRQFLLRWLSFAAQAEVTIQKNTRLGSINSKCIPIVSSWSICLIEPAVHISDYSFCLDTFIWD